MKQTLTGAMLVATMVGSTFAPTPAPSRPIATPLTSSPTPSAAVKMPPAASTARFQARDIIGTCVKHTAGETIGEGKDLMSISSPNIAQAMLAVGGFLGLGDTLGAVPYDQLNVSCVGETTHVMYATTKAELAKMPTGTYAQTTAASPGPASHLRWANVKNNTHNTLEDSQDLSIPGDTQVPHAMIAVGGL